MYHSFYICSTKFIMASTLIFLAHFLLALTAAKPYDSTGPAESSGIDKYDASVHGDMRFSEGQLMETTDGIIGDKYRWPNGVVPYCIHSNLTTEERALIIKVMKQMMTKICIKFVPWKKGDPNYINITADDTGCWSYVGMHGGGQVLNLKRSRCMNRQGITHELLHAIGFIHEHSRFNRDKYVTIVWKNIQKGLEDQFEKYPNSGMNIKGCAYDYGSILHYEDDHFSKNGNKTILTKDPNAVIGKSTKMSKCDIKRVNNMYKCRTNIFGQFISYLGAN